MYTKISNPEIIIYDGETKKLIGTAKFNLSPTAESDLLQLVNYNIAPSSLLLLNASLYEPSKTYLSPTPYFEYMREGRIRALFTDVYTKNQVPIEIIIKYNARANSANPKNQNFYDSVNFYNIEVKSVERMLNTSNKKK
ncbi:MAG: hypothetical protein AB7E42_03945 [Anaerotignaceae bacterium]